MGRSLGLNLAVGRSSGFLRGRKRDRASILGPWRPLGTSHIPLKSDRGLGTPLGHNMVLWYLLGRLPSLGKKGGSLSLTRQTLASFLSFLAQTPGVQATCLGSGF